MTTRHEGPAMAQTPKAKVVLPVHLPKSKEHQRSLKKHSLAVAWWATIEICVGRFDLKICRLKDIHRVDWARRECIMAEALRTYAQYPDSVLL